MINLKKTINLLPVLLLVLTGSCSNEEELPVQPKQGAALTIDLTGEMNNGAETSTRAMGFEVEPADGKVGDIGSVNIKPDDTDWTTHFFLRKKGETAVRQFDLAWTPGEKSGRVTSLKIHQKPITFTDGGATPANGDYELMAIGGGGKVTSDGKVSFAYDQSIDDEVGPNGNKIRVPFSSKWTDVRISDGMLAGKLDMKVMGTLICIRIGNTMKRNIHVNNITVTTTNMTPEGTFDPKTTGADGYAKWERTTISGTNGYHTAFPHHVNQDIAASADGEHSTHTIYTYFWGMPVEGNNVVQNKSMRISCDDYKVKRWNVSMAAAKTQKEFSYISAKVGATIRPGKFMRVDMDILRFKTAPEYVGEFNVSPTPKVLATVNSSLTSGYYRPQTANANPTAVVPEGYHIPSQDEWLTLFSPSTVSHVLIFENFNEKHANEAILINSEKNTFYAQYRGARLPNGNRVVYAIRFQKSNTGSLQYPAMTDNSKRAVYRYELCNKTAADNPTGVTLKITARYIGEDQEVTLSQISNESYWAASSNEDRTVELPACGFVYGDINSQLQAGQSPSSLGVGGLTNDTGDGSRYMTSTISTGTYYYVIQFQASSGTGPVTQENTQYVVIRPFLNALE